MKSVLLSGYYGFGNLGDELMLKNIARIFREAGISSIYAVSGDVEYSKSKHSGIEFIDRDDYHAIADVVRRVDFVALGGGGLFQDHNRLETAGLFESPKMGVHSYINVPLIAHIYRKPIAYLFQGVGPLFSEDSRNFTRYAYSLSNYISVRDRDSMKLLEEIGVRDVVLSADPGFLYPLENLKPIREKPRIGISLRQWVDKSVEEKIVASFVDFLNIIPENYDFSFFSFQDRDESNTDSSIYRRIRAHLQRPENLVLIRSKDSSLEDMERVIAEHDFLIGMRLHSIILAIKYGIPFIAIPYWNKVDHLLTETGLIDLSVSIKDISGEKIQDKFVSLLSEPSEIKERIEKGTTIIEQRLRNGTDTMKDFLTGISEIKSVPSPVERPAEKSTLPTEWISYKIHQERLKKQFYEKRYSNFMVERILRRSHYKKIVVYPSPIHWEIPLFQRPHQIFKELSKRGYLVFFLTPNPVGDRAEPIREINENLYLIKDIDMLYCLKDEPIILWVTWTPNIVCKELFPKSIVVYDWIDELDVFGFYSKFMEIDHRKLLYSADIVLATSDSLLEEAKSLRPDATLVPNGVCIKDFKVEGDFIPEDMAGVLSDGKPIIGYYGLLADWRMDYDLVNYLCRECKDLNFVFIGPSYDESSKKLRSGPNLFLLGPKKYEELRYYLKRFDVAIIPYKVDRITNSIFPVKLCEYMAGGKPVVTTNMQECKKFKSVFVSESYEDFISNLRKALLIKAEADYLKILAGEAYNNRWEGRVDKVVAALESESHAKLAKRERIGDRLSIATEEAEAMQKLLNHSLNEIDLLNLKLVQLDTEKNNIWNKLNQTTEEKDNLWNQLNQAISERNNLWNQLSEATAEKDNLWNQLNSIYSSNFWKVARFYYKVRNSWIPLRGIYLLLRWLKRKIKDDRKSAIRKTPVTPSAHTRPIPDQLSADPSEHLSKLVLAIETSRETFSWKIMRVFRRFREWVVLGNLKSRWEFCKWVGRKISRRKEPLSSPSFDPIGSEKFYDLESLQKAIMAARQIRAWKIMCFLRGFKVELIRGDLKRLWRLNGLISEIFTNKEGRRWVAYDPIPEELMEPPTHFRPLSASAVEAVQDGRQTFIFALDRGWGDILMSLPVAETLKKRDRAAKVIYFLEREDHLSLLQNNPFIDGIHLSRDHILSYINAKIFDIRSTPSDWHRARIHITDMIANHFGIQVHTHRSSLYIPDDQVFFKKFGSLDPYVVVHMQSATKEKDWDLNNWASVFEHLYKEYGLNTVIVGGFDEEVLPSGELPYVFDLRGNISLSETVNLMKRARLFVGIDSGPMHIAGALNIPSIVLWGNTSPIICGIDADVVYNIEPDRLCQKGSDWACHFFPCPEKELCINKISIEDVIGCIDDCLSEKTGLLVIHIGKNPWPHAGYNAKWYTFLQRDSFNGQVLNQAIYSHGSEYIAIISSESINPPWDELEKMMAFIKMKGIRIVSSECLRYIGHGVYGEYTDNDVTKCHRGSDDFILFHRNVFTRIGGFDSRFRRLSGCLRDFYFMALLLNETLWYMKNLLPRSMSNDADSGDEEMFQRKWREVDLRSLEHLESISLTSHYERDETLFLIFSHCSFDFNGGGQRWDSLTKIGRRYGYRLFYVDDVMRDEDTEAVVKEFLETPAPRKMVIWARPVPRYQKYFDRFILLAIPQIYDCIDDWREIMKEDQTVSSFEEELIRKSTMVTVTAETLRERIRMNRPWQDNIPFIPNGADPEIFDYKRNYERPADLKKSSLTIGYFGSLAEWWIDDDLLSHLATRLGDQVAINLIGPCNQKYRDIFSKYTNIDLLGQKKHDQLPPYLSHFDVALIPFRLIPVTEATNPVKVYEYLFGGKPVVSTDLPEVRRLPYTLCSKGPEEFLSNVLKASRMEINHGDIDKFRIINAWKSRFQELMTQIQMINVAGSFVDIVIVSYNTKEVTYNCIRSIERHTKNHHIFVIDNQSTDGSIEMLEEFSRKGRLSLIRNQKNEGYGRAVNKAIQLGSSKFIAMLNSDIEVLSGWLEPLLEALDSNDQIAAVGPKLIGPSGNIDCAGVWGTNSNPLIRFAEKNHFDSFNRVLENVYISGACMVSRRRTFEELGKFDERFFFYFEDMDFCFKARYQGYKVLYVPYSVVVHHRAKASEGNRDQIQKWYRESQFQFFEKWKDRLGDPVEFPLE